MLSEYIQIPYIKTPLGLATPFFIISVVYLLILGVFLGTAKNNGLLKIEITAPQNLMRGSRNKIIISSLGYPIFIFSCIILPSFIDKENLLLKSSKIYLQLEILAFILLFVFFCAAFLNKVNKETHIKAANCIFRYLIWISLGTWLLTGQLDYTYWKNILIFVVVWALNGLFFVIEIKPVQECFDHPAKFDLIPYGAVKSAEDLFPSHKKQAEEIAAIISSSSAASFSICVSGKWGSGKTSVMHGVIELLKEDKEKAYDVIYVNALELDNKKTVLTYLMTQIREKLKSRGVYAGINSEYKEFVASFTGSLTSSAIGAFLQKKLTNDEDYRAQKEKLEEVLERTYKNGKLIVIVDDIERCDRNTAREYLFLIKEVATMKGCISVFVTDYDMLNKVVSTEAVAKSANDFLNKFFNYRIDLRDEAPEDIFSFYDGFFCERDPAFESIYRVICKSPGTWYREAIDGLTAKLKALETDGSHHHLKDEEKQSFEKKVREQKECISLFRELMQNPRNVAKFYNVYRNHVHCYVKNLRLFDTEEASKYTGSRNIGQVLYFIAFVDVFLPSEYEQLKRQGPRYIDPLLYDLATREDANRRLLVELAQGLVFGGYDEFGKLDGYIKEDVKKFIKNYLAGKADLHQLINTFTSQEEEWLTAMTEKNDQLIEEHWEEMVLMVFQKGPNENSEITSSWRNEKFLFLLEFAEQKVKADVWTSDKLFSLFDLGLHIERYWSLGTGLMQTFWKHVEKSGVYKRPSPKRVDNFRQFLPMYAYVRSDSLHKLVQYLIPLESDDIIIDLLQDHLLTISNSLGQNLSNFLKKIEKEIPNFTFSTEGWYKNLKELSGKINDYLVDRGIAGYSDVREDILHMLDTAEEFRSLENLAVWVEGKKGVQAIILEDHIDNIDAIIDFFEEEFNRTVVDIDAQRKLEKKFTDFFRILRESEGITLTKKQVERLHQLVESYVELAGVSSLPYRRVILSISENNE